MRAARGRREWQATNLYSMELFVENRFLRSGAVGCQELGVQASWVPGINPLRKWT
jgi:hypothetical protein